MPFTLSLNTNPLVNRFAEPGDLIDVVARDLRVRDLQLTHEFINPDWPPSVVHRLVRDMRAAMQRTGVRVTSGMTGPYGRLNHFGHPDADVRRYFVDWFKTFADITGALGGTAIGSQFAILTYRDYDDLSRRDEAIRIAIDCWSEVAEHARAAGLDHIFWEPMSVGREFGATIETALEVQALLTSAKMAVPMRMMADIDHGDVSSTNPDDFDPYAWARAVSHVSPIIHVKQSLMDKGGHRPFTPDFNAVGQIHPEPLLQAILQGGGRDNEICLELSFKEREPDDRDVIPHIAESVAFWASHVETGSQDLRI